MKIKDIVKILSAVDGEQDLFLEVGRDSAERAGLGLLEYEKGECLDFLLVDEIRVTDIRDDSGMIVCAILCHNNWSSDVIAEYMRKGVERVRDED